MAELGQKLYIMAHAYHHYLGEVVEVLGKNSIKIDKVRRVYSCQRGWTDFFKDGCKDDTTYAVFPDGHEIHNYMSATPWHHEIPG